MNSIGDARASSPRLVRTALFFSTLAFIPACLGSPSSSQGGGSDGGDESIDNGETDTGTGATTGACESSYDLGSFCNEDCDCRSDACYPLGESLGSCGQCTSDADCPQGGCNMWAALAEDGASCSRGELGGGCETDAACNEGLVCAALWDAASSLYISTCSTCATDSDCGGTRTECTANYDFETFGGFRNCAAPESIANGGFCDPDGDGRECQSEICERVNASGLGIVYPGVCGRCRSDSDCENGEACVPGEVVLATGATTPSRCE